MSQHLAKNTAFMTAASIGQKLIAFVYFLLLARIMMPERTGVFFLATSIITMFSVFTDLGLSSVLVREVAKRPNEIKQIVRESVGLKFVLSAVAIVIVFIASLLLHYDALTTQLIWITTIVMVLDAFALLSYGILRGAQQLKYEAVGIVIGQFITVLIGSVSLFFFPNVQWLVVALICGSFTNLSIAIFHVVKKFGWEIYRPDWNKKNTIALIKIMTPFALAGIFTKIYSSVDVILISKMMSTIAVGIYSVAYKFTYAFQFLPLAFSAALYPSLSAAIEQDSEITTKTFSRAIWYILLIATPIVFGIWLIAPELVKLLGHGYVESVPILRILIFVLFPSFLEIPFGALLNASNRQSWRMKVLGGSMLLNVCLDIFLIPRFGLMGAIIGSLVSYTAMILAEFILVTKFLPTLLNIQLLKLAAGTLVSGLFMLGAGLLIKPVVHWIIVIPCIAIVYLASLWFTKSFTKNDLGILRSLFHKKTPVI